MNKLFGSVSCGSLPSSAGDRRHSAGGVQTAGSDRMHLVPVMVRLGEMPVFEVCFDSRLQCGIGAHDRGPHSLGRDEPGLGEGRAVGRRGGCSLDILAAGRQHVMGQCDQRIERLRIGRRGEDIRNHAERQFYRIADSSKDFPLQLLDLIEQESPAEAVRFASDKVLQSYKNGLKAGREGTQKNR